MKGYFHGRFAVALGALLSTVCMLSNVYAQIDTTFFSPFSGSSGGWEEPKAIAVDRDGYIILSGDTRWWTGGAEYTTIKYTPGGDSLWIRTYGGPAGADDMVEAVAVDTNGNIYVTGWSAGGATLWDVATIKYNPDGDTQWVRRYNAPVAASDVPNDMTLDADGYVYITGWSDSADAGTYADYLTIKYTPSGDTVWVRKYASPSGLADMARSVAVDDSGNVYVTGYVDASSNTAWATIKYTADGTETWVRRLTGPNAYTGMARRLALDGAGNIYVMGDYYYAAETSLDIALVKYNKDGDTLWLRRYDGPASGSDEGRDLVVDGEGNIYVLGMSNGIGTSTDYVLIKYAPSGDTLWTRRYNGTGNRADEPEDMTLDAEGNVYVTGASEGVELTFDYLTIKYSPEGDSLQTLRFNYWGDQRDQATDLAVDSIGRIYVTGWTMWTPGSTGWLTLAYWIPPPPIPVEDTALFIAFSPVNLVVTDPVGDSIGVDFNTILAGANYDTLTDYNEDGEPDDIITVPSPYVGEYRVRVVREEGVPDSAKFTLSVRINGNQLLEPDGYQDVPVSAIGVTIPETYVWTAAATLPGDCNADGAFTSADIIYLVNFVFKGGTPPVVQLHGDVNCNGTTTSADIIYMVYFIFKSGTPPCSQSGG